MKRFMEQLVCNERLKQRLCSDILSDSFSHAYIIEGVKGSGRHTVARLTAAALSCENKKNTDMPLPCGDCEACRKIFGGISPDVMTVGAEGKATLGVDVIRALREDVYTVPNELDNKIYIIEDADKMTVQAQNAFLLTLEEPPAHVGFLLLCERADRLLETIRSRAPILRTEPVSRDDIDRYITEHDKRAVTLKTGELSDYNELLMAAENGIGKALELLDPKALAPILEKRRLAKDFVYLALSKSSRRDAVALISRFSQKRDGLSEELSLIYKALGDLIKLKKSDEAILVFYESRSVALDVCELASSARLLELFEKVSGAGDRIAANANVRLTLISLMSETGML